MHFFSTGKPVAVTSNRGTGKALLRPGANPQLEQQYYQKKLLNGKAGTDKSVCMYVFNCCYGRFFSLKLFRQCTMDKFISFMWEISEKKYLWTTECSVASAIAGHCGFLLVS